MSDPVPPVSDALLLRRAREGDVAAFEALIRPHLGTVRRLARSFARDPHDADDLAQDAMLRAFRAIGGFEGRSKFSTWLYVIVRSALLDSKRARRRPERFASDTADELEDASASPETSVDEKRRNERLWQAIAELDESFRIPLVLFAVEGLSYEEIASVERIPIGTVRSRISRAKARLAEILAAGVGSKSPSAPAGTEPAGPTSNPTDRQER